MINNETWEEWLEHPATEQFKKYLLDSAKEEAEITTNTIISGGILTESEQVRVNVLCETLESIADISLEEIQDFYKEED